ncbi:MAG: sugar ABC transporter permease [candidate division NC10 bacterium]|nr:sugar ABC transporter permease [candidate division NC10 bacterium]
MPKGVTGLSAGPTRPVLRSRDAGGRGWAVLAPYVYLVPAAVVLAAFVYWPLIETVNLSFYEWNLVSPSKRFVGFANYRELLTSQAFWTSVVNTILAILAMSLATIAAPLAVAVAALRVQGVVRLIYRAVIFSPTVVSMAIASLIWLWIYNPIQGLIAHLVRLVGGQGFAWLTDPQLAIWAIILVTAWKTFGYNFVIFVAGLLSIPRELMDAARIDGAGEWHTFRHVTWPLLTPTTLFVVLTTLMLAPQYLVIPTQILTQGGPNQASNNLGYIIWEQGFEVFRVGNASAIAVAIFVGFLAFSVMHFRLLERGVHYEA